MIEYNLSKSSCSTMQRASWLQISYRAPAAEGEYVVVLKSELKPSVGQHGFLCEKITIC
jgi:hypothetical protein